MDCLLSKIYWRACIKQKKTVANFGIVLNFKAILLRSAQPIQVKSFIMLAVSGVVNGRTRMSPNPKAYASTQPKTEM